MFMRHLSNTLVVLLLLSGCNNIEKKNNVPDTGVISYLVEYPEEISNSPNGSLMPKELLLSFSEQQLKISLKGSFNVFSLNFISLTPNDSCTTIFKVMDKNLISKDPNNKQLFFFNRTGHPEITFLNHETKVIAGFKCKKAVVKFKDFDAYNVFYTSDINLQSPNRNTPLTEIKGVLMDFFVLYNGIKFHFIANSFDNSHPSYVEFKIPENAKQSSQKEIETLITSLINHF